MMSRLSPWSPQPACKRRHCFIAESVLTTLRWDSVPSPGLPSDQLHLRPMKSLLSHEYPLFVSSRKIHREASLRLRALDSALDREREPVAQMA